jgi:hypothetical protein
MKVAGDAASTFELELVGRSADRRAQRDLADTGARIAIVALFSLMAMQIGADFVATGRLTGLLLLASEALVALLTVFRRAPLVVDRSIRARVLTTIATMGPPLVRPSLLAPLAPEAFTVLLCAIGLLLFASVVLVERMVERRRGA